MKAKLKLKIKTDYKYNLNVILGDLVEEMNLESRICSFPSVIKINDIYLPDIRKSIPFDPRNKKYNLQIGDKNYTTKHNSIFINLLPDPITNIFKKFNLRGLENIDEIRKSLLNENQKLETLNNEISNLFNSFGLKNIKTHSLTLREKGLLTTAKNKTGFIGLHLDSSNNQPENLLLRICMNLSSTPRHFFIIPYYYSLGENPESIKMFENFNNYKLEIVRLTINPFEYYIAPTENFIHDGSTYWMETSDLSLSLLSNVSDYYES